MSQQNQHRAASVPENSPDAPVAGSENHPPLKSNPASVQIALCLALFLVPLMGSSLNLALPLIGKDFSMSAFALTFPVSMYLVAAAMFQMPAARMADLVGKKKLFILGLAAFGLFCLLGGLSWSGMSLIVFRFFSGFGSALVFATNMAILTSVFPPEHRGKALGVNTAVTYFSIAVGPFVGGVLSEHFGWRSIFFICAALSLIALVVGVRAIKDEWIETKGEPFDLAGSVAYLLSVGLLVLGFAFLPRTVGWGMIATAVLAAIVFFRIERGSAFPMMNLGIFATNRHFRLSSLSAMINYAASFAIGFIVSLYLQFVLGLPAGRAGFILMAQPATQSVLSPLGGRLSDRMNPSILATSGMGLIAIGLYLLSRLTSASPILHVVLILVLVGVGFAMFSSPNVNIIMGSVPLKLSGLASATTGTARLFGQSLSMAITSLVFHQHMGDHELTVESAHMFPAAMRSGFIIFCLICLVGVYTSASKLFDRKSEIQ